MWWLLRMTTVTQPCCVTRCRASSNALAVSQTPGRRRPSQVTQAPVSRSTVCSPLMVIAPDSISSR